MSTTHKFETVVSQLRKRIDAEGNFALKAAEAETISKGLKKLLLKLPAGELNLTKASGEAGETADKWSLKGAPKMASLPVPGFPNLNFDLPKAKVALKLTDGGEEDGEEKDPKFELVVSATVPIAGATIPVSLKLTEKDDQTLVFGDSKEPPLEADLVALAENSNWSDAAEELLHVADLIKLRKARLDEATFVIQVKDGKATIQTFTMQAGLTFGVVKLSLMVGAQRNDNGEFDRAGFKVKTIVAYDGESFQLGALVNDLAGMTVLPDALDPRLKSVSLERVFIPPGKKRLNPKDTQRIVLQSPAGSKKPEFLITSAFDEVGKKYLTVRMGWPDLKVVSLPLIGDQMQLSFEPLLVLFTNKTLNIVEAQNLFALDAFEGLETLGTPEDRVEEVEIRRGFHCTGIFKMGDLLEIPYHFPIKVSKDEADDRPFDPAELEEPEAAAALPVERKVKALQLQGISFKYESGRVTVMVSGVLNAKGLSIAPLGLRASFALKEPSDGGSRFSAGIDGGVLGYKNGGLTVSGGFLRDTSSPGAADYIGSGLLEYGKNFSMAAAFAFRDGEQKQLFLFAYVRRQLGGPAWCYITGLAAGFGYNRSFKVPTVDKVNSFPLIAMANNLARGKADAVPEKMDGNALQGIVEGLREYIKPDTSGANFGTAGITFTTFGYMNSTVLLTVMFGPHLEFSLLGSSTIDVPAKNPAAHADVQLVGSVKPDDGLFALDAVLGPSSYVLAKSCRLTGGFGLRTWFSGEHARDFVVSLGGYHPAYDKPKHYPAVPRLGFLWKVSSTTRLSGFAYLAITPKNIQMGGALDMAYDADPLHAWLHVEAHFLISWDPFYYDVALQVELGVSFRMDLLFCSVTLTIDISADLHLWGPDFSGRASVHLWFASFSFNFGAPSSNEEPKLLWEDFVSAFITPLPSKPKPKVLLEATADEPQAMPLPLDIVSLSGTSAAPEGMRITDGDFAGKLLDWIADPQGTELTVVTTIPAESAQFNEKQFPGAEAVFAHPLAGEPHIEPELRVTLTKAETRASLAATGLPFDVKAVAVVSAVPRALWGDKTEKGKELIGGNETLKAITQLTLAPTVFVGDKSLPVDVDVLLFHEIETPNRTWHAVQIPTRTFKWERDNPFRTAAAPEVSARRKRMLEALGRLDVLPAGAAEAIDLRNVKAGKPCFMAKPVLCSLGTAITEP